MNVLYIWIFFIFLAHFLFQDLYWQPAAKERAREGEFMLKGSSHEIIYIYWHLFSYITQHRKKPAYLITNDGNKGSLEFKKFKK